jgi:hypothetical protein
VKPDAICATTTGTKLVAPETIAKETIAKETMLTGAATVGVHARNLPIVIRPMTDSGRVVVVDEISDAAKTLQNAALTSLDSAPIADRPAGCGVCNAKASEVLVTATMNGPAVSTRAVTWRHAGPNIAVANTSVTRGADSLLGAATDTNGRVTGRDTISAGVTSAAVIISTTGLGHGLTDAAGGITAGMAGHEPATLDAVVGRTMVEMG